MNASTEVNSLRRHTSQTRWNVFTSVASGKVPDHVEEAEIWIVTQAGNVLRISCKKLVGFRIFQFAFLLSNGAVEITHVLEINRRPFNLEWSVWSTNDACKHLETTGTCMKLQQVETIVVGFRLTYQARWRRASQQTPPGSFRPWNAPWGPQETLSRGGVQLKLDSERTSHNL